MERQCALFVKAIYTFIERNYMKVEVIDISTQKTIEIYLLQDFSMRDFSQWSASSEVEEHLNQLLNIVKRLDSKDPVTQEYISNPTEVDFYLPDPLKNQMFSQLAKLQMDTEESSNQFQDVLKEVIEKVSTPELKSSTILYAVVTEVLQNHYPPSNYKVKIYDE